VPERVAGYNHGVTLDPRRCYRAIASRDPRFDGRFFTGVTTTGVYCRPVCPSRTPRPGHVRFFSCAAAAQAAGFRPCLRCRPEAAPGTPAWAGTSAVVRRALRLIEEGALDGSTVHDLSLRLGLGERQLRRLFRDHVGASPADVARARRADFAKMLLDQTALPVTEIAHAAGFGSIRQFNDVVQRVFRHSPRELRRVSRRSATDATSRHHAGLRLAHRGPFDWRGWLAYMGRRVASGVEHVDDHTYRRTIALDGTTGVMTLRPDPAGGALRLSLDVPSAASLIVVAKRARQLCDLVADPGSIEAHLRRSPLLRTAVRRRPGLRIPGAWDPFEIAVRAVLGQQVSVAAATTLVGRLVRACGAPFDAGQGLTHLFPTAAAIAQADLGALGVPGRRAQTLRALARAVAAGELVLTHDADADATTRRLMDIPGIGPWTAQYVALRGLGDPDAFPAGDLALRRAAGGGTVMATADLEALAEDWRPWRGYAAMHLWEMSRETADEA
jgi:AraC family transcriptional regulator of adaptative response / DNA-3-methyladenine glycosylase II